MIENINVLQYTMLIIGTVFIVLWLILYFKNCNKFNEFIKPLEKNEYFASEIFFIGMGFMSIIKFNINNENKRRIKNQLAEIKGDEYANYYYYVIQAAKITYVLTLLPLSFLISALVDDIIFFVLLIALAIIIIAYLDIEINNSAEKKRELLLMDFPQVLSKLTLLMNTGIPIREAWSIVEKSGTGILYQQMKLVTKDMSIGTAEIDAYRAFADRCAVKEIRKFISVLVQNIQKGNSDAGIFIREMSREAWEQKKHMARRKGENAGTRLLIPVGIMFLGVMMMIIVPIFSSM